ncbi:hypothetical protein ACFWPV_10000 [Streptomyces uncialis]|uniref:hypothetical protein n=1 Tax=Streptomyces uncialis TaxID=1048205 RepID=UPI003647F38E
MSDLLAAAGFIAPGDLVIYHGSIPEFHGLYVALPCVCPLCLRMDELGFAVARYDLIDPFGEQAGPFHVRRQSITRSAACA